MNYFVKSTNRDIEQAKTFCLNALADVETELKKENISDFAEGMQKGMRIAYETALEYLIPNIEYALLRERDANGSLQTQN